MENQKQEKICSSGTQKCGWHWKVPTELQEPGLFRHLPTGAFYNSLIWRSALLKSSGFQKADLENRLKQNQQKPEGWLETHIIIAVSVLCVFFSRFSPSTDWLGLYIPDRGSDCLVLMVCLWMDGIFHTKWLHEWMQSFAEPHAFSWSAGPERWCGEVRATSCLGIVGGSLP